MKLDVIMWPDLPWPTMRQEWLHAERLGLGRGWLYDHLNLGSRPVWHEAYTTLAAAAAATTTIGVGTMVTAPNFRHPVTTAKAALSLDALAEGRFVLGLGAGGPGPDSDSLGGPPLTRADRTARFAEFTELTHLLLTRRTVDYTGHHFTACQVTIAGTDLRASSHTTAPVDVPGQPTPEGIGAHSSGEWADARPRTDATGAPSRAGRTSLLPRADRAGVLPRADRTDVLSRADRTDVLSRADRTDVLSRTDRTRGLPGVDAPDVLPRTDRTRVLSRTDAPGALSRRPRLAVAATGRRGMALAARYADVWITQDVSQDDTVYAGSPHAEVRRQIALLDDVCAEQHRDPGTLARLAVLGYGGERPLDSIEAFRDCVGRYAELGITTLAVLWPRGDQAAAHLNVLEQAAALCSTVNSQAATP
ncbi:LLM class flavin-dependent oxidoreductase [Actinoplanes xinjiangensis]|uniref:LLM class flavin-dependent oxidoreductase n=1 Tax=Actinoplanes xinjiangensis TaxID=512350 RepID=UPI00343BCCA0